MAMLKTKDVSASLCRKGFVERVEKHHKYYFLYCDGIKTTIKTYISHGDKEVGDYLQGQMAKQTKLVKKDFVRLVECELSGEDYVRLLRGSRYL